MSAAYLHVSALQATCEQWQQFTWRRNSEVITSNAFVKVISPPFFSAPLLTVVSSRDVFVVDVFKIDIVLFVL